MAEVVSCETTLLHDGNDLEEVTSGVLKIKGSVMNIGREPITKTMNSEYGWTWSPNIIPISAVCS